MGLSNSASRARNYAQTNNQDQGGGNKKAGFPYQVGRESWTSIHFGTSSMGKSVVPCGKLSCLRTLRYTGNVHPSRPIGGDVRTTYYLRGI
tara:strand:+ start:2252 stop:2524 length:273 start_codon:yes stop_codon:yes gene_type:complete